ncbi:exonuclease domain-containing protein [Kitasatospora atroaurantiaca]|uniref:DNA polymerase-3 subunit epsilon n=1 Tax=Kitasatospora atroaurantiaca TaxID=285545 RepID=A0A561EN46_9ACTN|nr:exonuclease domain-containing protein [Kitasatospora atroaurantiaca]TWE17027.1 DNA polymerase-3 subunit epsilon [Kitasatospora atroaurantiaca]
MTAFWTIRKVGFDTETTGTDVERDRIVTAALVFTGGGVEDATVTYLINPGVPIPVEASNVHGVTTEMALAGQDPAAALSDIADKLVAAVAWDMPVIAFNLPFDFTILDRELIRHGLPTVMSRVDGAALRLIDPLVIDRQLDRYRRGSRKLKDVAEHYGVAPQEWHTAEADATAAVHVAEALFARYPQLGAMSAAELIDAQQLWHRRWAADFQTHLRESEKDPGAVIDGAWPLKALPVEVAS